MHILRYFIQSLDSTFIWEYIKFMKTPNARMNYLCEKLMYKNCETLVHEFCLGTFLRNKLNYLFTNPNNLFKLIFLSENLYFHESRFVCLKANLNELKLK